MWARRVLSGLSGDPPLLAACPLYDVGARLGLVDEDATVLWLLYGARLCGADGVAPVDLVPFCAQRWEDALGRSHLAQSGAFVWRRARVQLAREVADTLDDLPSRYGQVCSGPPVPPRTVAVVAPSSVALAAVGSWAARRVGSLVIPSERGLRVPDRFVLEARARGQVPLIAARAWGDRSAPATAAVFVVDDAAAAARRGLPVALTWPAEVTSAG